MSHYLVRAQLPLDLAEITPQERETRLAHPIVGPIIDLKGRRRHEGNESIEDLVNRIDQLETKIDTLITLLVQKEQNSAKERTFDISLERDAIEFSWPNALQVGSFHEINLTLSLIPPDELKTVIEVLACQKEENDFRIRARFDRLSEQEEDALHRFMLTAQRRTRRASQSASPPHKEAIE